MSLKVGVLALASVIGLSVATAASASELDKGWFVGGDLGIAKRDMSLHNNAGDEFELNGQSFADRMDGSAVFGARLGKYVTDNVRLYTDLSMGKGSSYAINGYNSSVDELQWTFSADYVDYFPGSQKWQYFAGATAGYNKMDVEVVNGPDSAPDSDQNTSGVVYGAQAGVIYNFTDHISGELGYQFLALNNDIDYQGVEKFEANNKQTVMMNVSYQF